jgi:hypothetical protein
LFLKYCSTECAKIRLQTLGNNKLTLDQSNRKKFGRKINLIINVDSLVERNGLEKMCYPILG